MNTIINLIVSNIYLYICIVVGLIILTSILIIIASNKNNRKKIKNDFIEAEKVENEMEKIESEPSELEDIIKKMQQDIDVKPEDVVKQFEEEQEKKAIISYKELVDNVKAGKIEVVDDEESDINFVENLVDEPINVSMETSSVTPEMVKEAIETITHDSIKEEPKKFKQSEFISPIYGVMDTKLEYPKVRKQENIMDIMNTRDYNELTEEIKKQEEFLRVLKEFRNNL